jgi:acylglycerol lipase
MALNVDLAGRFLRGTFKTANGSELATYSWLPDGGVVSATGCVFLLHGYSSHARFEYLDTNDRNERTVYAGSIPSHLNALGLVVFAHDHLGHGLSSGTRLYWNRLDELRQGAVEFCEATLQDEKHKSLLTKPRFVMGMSMGGTLAIQIARSFPDLFNGYILLSPAVRPPDDMFGLYGRILSALGSTLDALVPRMRVLNIPLNEDPTIREAAMKDELVVLQKAYVRVAKEFQRAYADIDANAATITFPAVLMVIGSKDPIVSATGIQDFASKVHSADKEVKVFDHIGHEVIREEGCNAARAAVYDWVSNRLKTA